ncbi:MAG TPA: response regulator transcription factor [Azospirillaceae bacterium]|nr:response regulator transcription factor [Azospirillaceae bacterium]
MRTTGKTVLLVDDDSALRQSVAEQLALQEAAETVEAGDAAAALAILRGRRFDAILVDQGLPDMDGAELCRRLRADGIDCPIILLATGDPVDAATGATDQVAKPLRLGTLLAKLRAHLRQAEAGAEGAVAIGPYTFRPAAKMLLEAARDRLIRLTEKETQILSFLYRAGDRPIGRETLLGEVWGYNAGVTTHTLETHVYRLRRKIESDPANARILVTEPGGYRLVP